MACVLLFGAALAIAEEPPVRDPMRPFGAGAAGAPLASAGPRFALTAVLIAAERRVAIVNGTPSQQGESVDGATIVTIEADAVHLRDRGTALVIPLGRPGNGRPPIVQGETVP
jgi:hypothetical protein